MTELASAASVSRHYLLLTPVASTISGAKFKLTLTGPEGNLTTGEIRYIADKNRQSAAIMEALEGGVFGDAL